MRLLVVENSRRMQDALKYALDPYGEVVLAASADEAKRQLKEGGSFDVVFTDYHMRGGSGLEVIDCIQQSQDDIPVVLITAYGTKELTIEALNRRVFRFLEKPIRYKDLKQVIDDITSLQKKELTERRVRDLGLLSNLVFHEIGGGLQDLLSEAQSLDFSGIQEENVQGLADRFSQIRDTIFQTSNAFRNLKFLVSQDREISGALADEDLKEVLIRISDWLTPLALESKIDLNLDLPRESIWVSSLPGLIERAIKNVLINALEALRNTEGRKSIEVRLKETGHHCQLQIRNTGPEIPTDLAEHIFDFAVSTHEQGPIPRGIGLYVVDRVMKLIGGKATVQSSPQWTVFTLTFPLSGP